MFLFTFVKFSPFFYTFVCKLKNNFVFDITKVLWRKGKSIKYFIKIRDLTI